MHAGALETWLVCLGWFGDVSTERPEDYLGMPCSVPGDVVWGDKDLH